MKSKTGPVLRAQGGERLEKEAGHFRGVGGSFNKQKELPYEACLRRQ